QAVLARELAAGAGAFERGLGEIDLHLVGFGTAANALAPGRSLVAAERHPLRAVRQTTSGRCRAWVRRQGQNLLRGPVHHGLCRQTEPGLDQELIGDSHDIYVRIGGEGLQESNPAVRYLSLESALPISRSTAKVVTILVPSR